MTGATEWPMEAVIEQRDEDGTWKFAGAVRDVKTGEAWIAKHGLGEDHRVRIKEKKEAAVPDHDYEPGDETTPMGGDPRCRICGEDKRSHA